MKYLIKYLPVALHDIEGIKLFNVKFSQRFQDKVMSELELKILSLSDNPNRAPIYEYNSAYRKLIVLNYLVFYKVNKNTEVVEIHRVLHQARNIIDILNTSP